MSLPKGLYDSKCYELACYFLDGGEPELVAFLSQPDSTYQDKQVIGVELIVPEGK